MEPNEPTAGSDERSESPGRGEFESRIQLHRIVSALLRAVTDPHALIETCANAHGDMETVTAAIAEAYRVGEVEAGAILALQVRRFTPAAVQQLRDELSSIERSLPEAALPSATGPRMIQSPNNRPGQPLRPWRKGSRIAEHDARSVVEFSGSRESLARLIDGAQLSLHDQVALGRLNAYCVAQGYEPAVSLLVEPQIDQEAADLFGPLLA